MSILKKIMTAIRGGAREIGDSVVDANAIRIFEQEIHDAQNNIKKAKIDLTEVVAKQMQESREVDRIKSEIEKNEGYAAQALEKGEESLAMEIAQKVATLEGELGEHQKNKETFDTHAARLKDLVKKSERLIKDHQRQLTMVKTTESVQKATASITDNFSATNSKMNSAKESLERIKKKQVDFDDKLKAAQALQEEATDKGLEDRMRAVGIGGEISTGQSVLDRIKAKKAES